MEVSHYSMENLDQKNFWSHGTILGYLGDPIRDPRVPRCTENIFLQIIYCTVVIDSRFYYIKSKDSVFVGPGSQFWVPCHVANVKWIMFVTKINVAKVTHQSNIRTLIFLLKKNNLGNTGSIATSPSFFSCCYGTSVTKIVIFG